MQEEKQLTNSRRAPRTLTSLLLLGLLGMVAVFGFVWLRFKTHNYELLVPQASKPFEDPDRVQLSTTPSSDQHQNKLLEGDDFRITKKLRDIPEPCFSPFESSFIRTSATDSTAEKVEIADPGQPFQFSDALTPGLPFRRLVLAGLGANSCFIYYQHGGRMYPSYCLAVMAYGHQPKVWVGQSRKEAATVEELRAMLRREEFTVTAGPVC